MSKQQEALRLALEALMEATKIHASSCKCSVCRAVIVAQDALAEQPAQPTKPLTNAQIGAVAADIWGSILIAPQSYQAFARAVEAAHGIKENT